MKISVIRTGGFAGLTEQVGNVDTAALDPVLAHEVEQQVREARFFELPSSPPGRKIGADLIRYEVTVSDADRTSTVHFFEDGTAATSPMHRLIDLVRRVH